MRRAPQGHRREPFLRNFLGEQKVPRRRQNARRAEKRGPQAQRGQRPEGEEKHFKKWPGPQAQREQHPEGEEKHFKKWPGPQAQREQRLEGEEKYGMEKGRAPHQKPTAVPPSWGTGAVSIGAALYKMYQFGKCTPPCGHIHVLGALVAQSNHHGYARCLKIHPPQQFLCAEQSLRPPLHGTT